MHCGKYSLFYSRPLLKVNRRGASFTDPNVEVRYEDELSKFERTCLILASKGFCGGNPEAIAKTSVYWVLRMMDFHKFTMDFREESNYLNNEYR